MKRIPTILPQSIGGGTVYTDCLTVRETAERLDCSISNVRRLLKKGSLKRYNGVTWNVFVEEESVKYYTGYYEKYDVT